MRNSRPLDEMIAFWILSIVALSYGLYLNLQVHNLIAQLKEKYQKGSKDWPFESDRKLFLLLAFAPGRLQAEGPELLKEKEVERILRLKRRWIVFIILLVPLFIILVIGGAILREVY